MNDYFVPPDITAAALRDAKDAAPHDCLEFSFDHDVIYDAEFQDRAYHGHMKLRRFWSFIVTEENSAIFDDQGIEILSENLSRGQLKKSHEESCGHPIGSGDPCNWCALKDAAKELIAVCKSGDVMKTVECMKMLEAHL